MKKEEYEALDRIRGILKDFSPEDTYIGKAFEGCVKQAEENLRYDGKMSWKAEYESKDREVARLTEKLAEVNKKLRKSEEARVDLTKELNQKDDAIARLEDAKNQLSEELEKAKKNKQIAIKEFHKWLNEYRSLNSTFKETWLKLEKAQTEILELKAKLYDRMTGEEVKE